jgi:hypothetical protein
MDDLFMDMTSFPPFGEAEKHRFFLQNVVPVLRIRSPTEMHIKRMFIVVNPLGSYYGEASGCLIWRLTIIKIKVFLNTPINAPFIFETI